jgi:uncharacterized protein YbaA (DUF1428 family)
MPKAKVGYVDGFVLVVPKPKVQAYKKLARDAGKIWMRCGALSYKECIGDDVKPDMGGYQIMLFPRLVKLKPSETVWFSYIEYKSKTHRDSVNKKVMQEMEKHQKDTPDHMKQMPFDMKRMSWGGFKVEVGLY